MGLSDNDLKYIPPQLKVAYIQRIMEILEMRHSLGLNDWEVKFLVKIMYALKDDNSLSQKQYKKLQEFL